MVDREAEVVDNANTENLDNSADISGSSEDQNPLAVSNPLDPISCAIYSFTDEEIKSHISNIQEGFKLNATKIKEMCKPIMQELFSWPHAASVFGTPVDPVALGLPDYFQVIKTPMDLGEWQWGAPQLR